MAEERLRIGQAYLQGFNAAEQCFLAEIERYLDEEAFPTEKTALMRLLEHLKTQESD
jgi:hypothetical protein